MTETISASVTHEFLLSVLDPAWCLASNDVRPILARQLRYMVMRTSRPRTDWLSDAFGPEDGRC